LFAGTDVTLGSLTAGTGSVSVIAGESILDGGDTDVDVSAIGLMLAADLNIGLSSNALDISVDVVSAISDSGDIRIDELDDITIDLVSVVVARVQVDGNVETISESQSDLVTAGDGRILVTTIDGSITVNDGDETDVSPSAENTRSLVLMPIAGVGISVESGVVLLLAQGDNRDINLNSSMVSQAGDISIIASGSIIQSSESTIDTITGAVYVEAKAGHITMADGSGISSVSGNVVLFATGSITVTNISSPLGFIGLFGETVIDASDDVVDLKASGLMIKTQSDVGRREAGEIDAIDVEIDSLSVDSSYGGIYVLDVAGFTIEAVSVLVNKAFADGSVAEVSASQSNIVAGEDGEIWISSGDSIQMTDGSRIQTSAGSITINAVGDLRVSTISSDSGDILVLVEGGVRDVSIDETANFKTTGDLNLTAPSGIGTSVADIDILVASLSVTVIGQGGIYLAAQGSLVVNSIIYSTSSGTSSEMLSAPRSLILAPAAGTEPVNPSDNAIMINVESGSLAIQGDIVNDGGGSVALEAETDVVVSAAITTTSGAVSVASQTASITVDSNATIKSTSGEVKLDADSDLVLAGDIESAAGDVEINSQNGSISVEETSTITTASGAVAIDAKANVNTQGSISTSTGSVNLVAETGSVVMEGNAKIESDSGAVEVDAANDVLLTVIDSTSGSIAVASETGSILDNLDGDGNNLVTSATLSLSAAKDIGSTDGGALQADASFVDLSGFKAENTSLAFADGKEISGSPDSFYGIVMMRDFEPSLVSRAYLEPLADIFASAIDSLDVHASLDEVLDALVQMSAEELYRFLHQAGRVLRVDVALLEQALRVLIADSLTVSERFNANQSAAQEQVAEYIDGLAV